MGSYVLDLREVDRTRSEAVGGKGAQLGELSRIDGIVVPPGFCVTTEAFHRVMAEAPIGPALDRLSNLSPDDREAISLASAEIREAIEGIAVPDDLAAEVSAALAALGSQHAYAVRSSATAEDLPTASFAGQQDTFLNVVGSAAVLDHLRRCWASLFTERAVSYRLRNDFDHRLVQMAVVVQRMVFPSAAGVMFTADPVTSNRTIISIEAAFGLGEALVSGRVNADVFKVRAGAIVSTAIAGKQVASQPLAAGGTEERRIDPSQQQKPTLTQAQVLRLARLGRRIEAHFGRPQDIEWCLADDEFAFVQSRPITTLFPIPAAEDGDNHVYVSVGHQQMMTDPMKPLGLSLFQLTAGPPMHEAGGRLFVDVTRRLASPTSRAAVLDALGRSDPLIRDALETVLEREGFVTLLPDDPSAAAAPPGAAGGVPRPVLETDPAIVAELVEDHRTSIAEAKRAIADKVGASLLDFIVADIGELKRVLFDPRSHEVFLSAMEASWWLNEHLEEWLGEQNVADVLTQSVPDNVTSEMGLALLDVADVIRPLPELVAWLEQVDRDDFLAEIAGQAGGVEARDAIEHFLDLYGMRCVGEIDVTRPRWIEHPTALLPVILANVRNFEPGAAARLFEQGLREARAKEAEVLERLLALPDGQRKADETRQRIDRARTFIGYREYPKYGIVSRYLVYKLALMQEAGRLVAAGVVREADDIFYLTIQELRDVAAAQQADLGLIDQRRQAFVANHALTPPRVLTSHGEAVAGSYRRADLPAGALVGLGVSAGIVEGRARVIHDMAEADLEAGDILVTEFTDPSWSPLFVTVSALVTEVGGLMTHGAVVAREYGLPAVVGLEHATSVIADGQQIRVNGGAGWVQILPS